MRNTIRKLVVHSFFTKSVVTLAAFGAAFFVWNIVSAALPAPGGIDSGLVLWLKADTGVFSNTGCSTAATDGGDAQCWADQSGSGNHFTGTNAPVYTATSSGINFLNTVTFNGSNDTLSNAASMFGATSSATIFAVGKVGSAATSTIFGAGTSGDNPAVGLTSGTSPASILGDIGWKQW